MLLEQQGRSLAFPTAKPTTMHDCVPIYDRATIYMRRAVCVGVCTGIWESGFGTCRGDTEIGQITRRTPSVRDRASDRRAIGERTSDEVLQLLHSEKAERTIN